MASPLRLIAVFVVIVVVAVGGATVVTLTSGGETTPDGADISGQSPAQFQPDAVNHNDDPEAGEIKVDETDGQKRILVDISHSNQVSETELEPIVEAAYVAGHFVEFGANDIRGSYAETLSNYDGVLVVQPRGSFSESERNALQNYTDAGGRVVVLGEPTQIQAALGLFGVPSAASFGADNLTQAYGFQVGAEMLFNQEDAGNDNNFKSVNASPETNNELTDGVETVSFDRAGYVVVNEQHEDASNIEVLYTAADGTKTLETRREGDYAMAVRNENLVFVADSSFLDQSEVYDADNEVFVGNLLTFLASGDLDKDFPSDGGDTGLGTPEPPERSTPTPTPTNQSRPTVTPINQSIVHSDES